MCHVIFFFKIPTVVYQSSVHGMKLLRNYIGELKRKSAVFLFNLSSHYHIYIVKNLFACRDVYLKNLKETIDLACEIFTSGFRPSVPQKRRLLIKLSIDWCNERPQDGFIRLFHYYITKYEQQRLHFNQDFIGFWFHVSF